MSSKSTSASKPLLRELWRGQGLCEGLDISLFEVAVLGLITCEEGLVNGSLLLFGGVRSVYYCPQGSGRSAAGDCERLKENEKKRQLDGMESSKSKSGRSLHAWMT